MSSFLIFVILFPAVMSLTLTFSDNSSILTADYFPPLELNGNYICGLVDFQTYNSIPNIDVGNNLLHIGDKIIEIPIGSYEIEDIEHYVQKRLEPERKFHLKANNNTLKSEIISDRNIKFNKIDSIGAILGFSKRMLNANTLYESDLPVNIIKVNAIRVECNIVTGSYINNKQAHTLHEFATTVGPGYKIVEVPANVIYLPVTGKQISSITLKIVDQDGDLVNFRGENITIRLHLKPENAGAS